MAENAAFLIITADIQIEAVTSGILSVSSASSVDKNQRRHLRHLIRVDPC